MDKKNFPFFESYYKSFMGLSPEIVGEIIFAMGAFYFDDADINLDGVPGAVYALIEPILENSKHISEVRSKAAKGNGAPKRNKNASKNNQEESKEQTKTNKNQTNEEQKQTDKEKEKDKDKDKDLKENDKRKAFSPPTLEEIKAYCKERNSCVDAEKFFEYFDTGGWVDSKGNKVKNWKQKIITWEKYGGNRSSPQRPATKFINFEEREYNELDTLENQLARN